MNLLDWAWAVLRMDVQAEGLMLELAVVAMPTHDHIMYLLVGVAAIDKTLLSLSSTRSKFQPPQGRWSLWGTTGSLPTCSCGWTSIPPGCTRSSLATM